jgi:hypothetical protein
LVFSVGAAHVRVAVPVAAGVTVTGTLPWAVLPAPLLQVIEKVVVAVSAALVCWPAVASLVVQLAAQLVVFVDVQVSTVVPPLDTVCGLADKVTLGAGAETVTVVDC